MRWKTALQIWLAVYPSITVVLWLVGPALDRVPLPVRTLAVSGVVVPVVVFVLLPIIQWLFASVTGVGGFARRR